MQLLFIFALLLSFLSYVKCQSFVLNWAELYETLLKESGPFISPPLVARASAIYATCMYDTWTVYDSVALPTYQNGISKRTGSEEEIKEAVSYAIYVALSEIFETRTDQLAKLRSHFEEMGYSHTKAMSKPSKDSPAGVGQMACEAVLSRRRDDGANAKGDEMNTVDKKPYSDYTITYAYNNPQIATVTTDCDNLKSINNWQPLKIPTRDNTTVTQAFLTPQMFRVPMYGTRHRFNLYRKYHGPPAYGTNTEKQFLQEAAEVLKYSSELDDETKIIAEFWADGPLSTFPPGHWHEIARQAAMNENLSLEKTIKLLYLQGNAVMDAGIAAWTLKKIWSSSRPITQIQCLYKGKKVKAWSGPYMGVKEIDAEMWQPYQNKFFVTPAFPGYISGHSTFSAASAEVLMKFFGDDKFRANSYTVKEGMSLFEPKITKGNPGYIEGVTDKPNRGKDTKGYVPAKDIKLSWKTWTEAAEQAGISRLYGGIHVQVDNVDGLKIGRRLGKKVFQRASWLFAGDARGQKRDI